MRNKVFAVIAFLVIGAGAVVLFYRDIPYRSRNVVIDVGPITSTAESNRNWPVSAAMSGLAVLGGILLIGFGARKD